MSKEEIVIHEETLLVGKVKFKTHGDYKIIVKKDLGKINVKLLDETGTYPLANLKYKGEGPEDTKIEGITDDNGVFRHTQIPLGYYEIEIENEYKTIIPTIRMNDFALHYQIVENYRVEIKNEIEKNKEIKYDFPL